MKKFLSLLAVIFFCQSVSADTTILTENFDTNPANSNIFGDTSANNTTIWGNYFDIIGGPDVAGARFSEWDTTANDSTWFLGNRALYGGVACTFPTVLGFGTGNGYNIKVGETITYKFTLLNMANVDGGKNMQLYVYFHMDSGVAKHAGGLVPVLGTGYLLTLNLGAQGDLTIEEVNNNTRFELVKFTSVKPFDVPAALDTKNVTIAITLNDSTPSTLGVMTIALTYDAETNQVTTDTRYVSDDTRYIHSTNRMVFGMEKGYGTQPTTEMSTDSWSIVISSVADVAVASNPDTFPRRRQNNINHLYGLMGIPGGNWGKF